MEWDIFNEVNQILIEMGGPGSGNKGHKGVKGQKGGSAPSRGLAFPDLELDDKEATALLLYQRDGMFINQVLRGAKGPWATWQKKNPTTVRQVAGGLDSILNRSVTTEDAVVYRRLGKKVKLEKGAVPPDKAYLSTTLSREYAESHNPVGESGNSLMILSIPKGGHAAYISGITHWEKAYKGGNMDEVLLPRKTQIRVVDIRVEGDWKIVDAVVEGSAVKP